MLKSFSLYTVALIIDKGVSFLLLPFFTFYLTTRDFGNLSLLNTIFSFTLPVVGLGVQGAISVNYFKRDKSLYPAYFSSSIVPPFVISVVLCLLILLARNVLVQQLQLPIAWLVVIPLFAFFSFFNTLLLIDCQIKNEPVTYVIFSLSNSLLTILLSAFFVIKLKLGYEGRLYGQYITIGVFLIVTFLMLKYKKKVLVNDFNLADCKDSLNFGLPLLPHTVGFMVINMADRFFINHFWGKETLGIYNIGFLIGSSISILSSAFATSVVPFSFDLFSQNTLQAKVKVIKVYWIFISALIVILVMIISLSPILFRYFIDQKFKLGLSYVKWIGIGFFFQGLYLLFGNVIFYLKKTSLFFYCSFFNIILNFSLNYFFVKNYGAIGASYAFSISSVTFCLIIAFLANRLYPLPWGCIFNRKLFNKADY